MGLVKRECSGVGKNGHGYPGMAKEWSSGR